LQSCSHLFSCQRGHRAKTVSTRYLTCCCSYSLRCRQAHRSKLQVLDLHSRHMLSMPPSMEHENYRPTPKSTKTDLLNQLIAAWLAKKGKQHKAAHSPCHALFHGEVCDSHSSSLDVHSPTFGDTPSMSVLPCSLPCHNHAL
jgi:hypothetical protein